MHRRGREEAYRWPSFFKIIHSSIIRDQQLGIPRKFIQKFGKDLSDVAVLKVPNGEAWCVEMTKANGQIWFHNGWREFVKYHSIRAGHFLVFRYDGDSNFYVLIFDMSGSEIGYLRNCMNLEEPDHDGRCLSTQKEEIEEENSEEILDGHDSSAKQELHSCAKASATRRRPVSSQEKNIAIQAARSFKSKHPFFTVIMHASYLHHKSFSIPKTFCMKYLVKKSRIVTVQVSDGRTWPVRYLFRPCGSKLSMGLSAFIRENNLGEGDVCLFELIKKKDIVLKVSIFQSDR